MKIDAEYLKKNRFWVLLGVATPLILIAMLTAAAGVGGYVASVRKKTESEYKKLEAKRNAKSRKWVEVAKKKAELHKGLETEVWKEAYELQKPLFVWPEVFEKKYHYQDGFFAMEVAADRGNLTSTDSAAPRPSIEIVKEGVDVKLHGTLIDRDEQRLLLQIRVRKDDADNFKKLFLDKYGRIKYPLQAVKSLNGGAEQDASIEILRAEKVKITITGPEGEQTTKLFNRLKAGDKVSVTCQIGKYFGDILTEQEMTLFERRYLDSIPDIIELAEPLKPDGTGLVQFKGWSPDRYEVDKGIPPPGSPFFHYVPKWDTSQRDKHPSWEAWTAKEDLWIQKEIYRIIGEANKYNGRFQCRGGFGNDWFVFERLPWLVKLRLDEKKRWEVQLTNIDPDYAYGFKEMVFWIKVDPNDPLPVVKIDEKPKQEGEDAASAVEPEPGADAKNSQKKLTAPDNVDVVKIRYDGEVKPFETVGTKLKVEVSRPAKTVKKIVGIYGLKQFDAENNAAHEYAFLGGGPENVYYWENAFWTLRLKLAGKDKIEVLRIGNRSSFPRRVDVSFKVRIHHDPKGKSQDRSWATFSVQYGYLNPGESVNPGGNLKPPRYIVPLRLPEGAKSPTGLFAAEQVLTWEYAAIKRLDTVLIGSGTAPGQAPQSSGGETPPGTGGLQGGTGVGNSSGSGTGTGATSSGGRTAHSHRTFPKGLVAFFKSDDAEATDFNTPAGEDPMGQYQGGAPSTSKSGVSRHGFDFKRYVEITSEFRKVPVAVVLIVDQEQLGRVLAAFTNSKLRFLTTQVIVNRYPESLRPLVVAKRSSGGSTPGSPLPPGGSPEPPGGTGGETGGIPPGGGNSPEPGGQGPYFPPTGSPPSGGGSDSGSAVTMLLGDERINNVEVVIYGYVTLYHRFPPRSGSEYGQ